MWKAEVCDIEKCWFITFEGDYDDFMDFIDAQGLDVVDVWQI